MANGRSDPSDPRFACGSECVIPDYVETELIRTLPTGAFTIFCEHKRN
jgi:hypothetical protein